MQFTLALYLLQAHVMECSAVCSRFLATYMRQFKCAVTHEEERLLEKRFQWDQGGTGFAHVLRSHAQPEDARALRRYIARTLRGREASEVRIRAAREQNVLVPDLDKVQRNHLLKNQGQPDPYWNPHTPGAEEPSTASLVDEVVRMLREEGARDEWVPSRDTLYDWGNRGQFSWCRDGQGRKALDAHGIAQGRNLVQAKRAHRALVQRALAAGMSRQAIKKAHQRGRLEAIVIWHERRQDLFAVDATGPEGEEVSIEGVCTYIEGRLAYDDLKQAGRDDLLMKLVELRRRLAAMDHSKPEQDS